MFLFQTVPTYAFYTKLSANTIINENHVIFDTVDLNIGGAYNVKTGITPHSLKRKIFSKFIVNR